MFSRRRTKRPFRLVRHTAEYVAFRLLCAGMGGLSVRNTVRLANGLAEVAMRLPAKWTRRDLACDNLRRAFPDWDEERISATARGMWVHVIRMVAEIVQFPRKVTLENCREVMVFRNRAECVSAACSGRPVLVLGGHFGNWEASMIAFGVFGFPMGVVTRELDNPLLDRWFEAERTRFGHRLYAKRGGYEGMMELLSAGGNLGLLCDQDAGRRGVFAEFFGRPASTVKSLALLALEHDALMVVGYGRRLPDDFSAGSTQRWARFEIGCETVLDPRDYQSSDAVAEITRDYTAALESAVRRSPEQYFWVHRRWKTAPNAKRIKRAKAMPASLPKAA